jgi:hypothetical protein
VHATCGTDGVERQPHALADLDHDGHLDRASVVREGRKLIISLHTVPGLERRRSFTLPGDYVEIGATRWKNRPDGDLWLIVGSALDERGERWKHDVFHLEGDRLAVAYPNARQASFHIDVDADGRPDPLIDTDHGAFVLRGQTWQALPPNIHPFLLQGMSVGDQQQVATDLDGDGKPDLLHHTDEALEIVESASFRVTARIPGKTWNAAITTWAGRTVIVANLSEVVHVIAADATHGKLSSFPGPSYVALRPELDPSGDGKVLALHSLSTHLVDRSGEVDLGLDLAGPAFDARPRIGPVRIDADAVPELLGVRMLAHGSPSFLGTGRGEYELVLLPPPGKGPGRRIYHRDEIFGDTRVQAGLVDLDGDGRHEILLAEQGSYSNCDMSGGNSESTVRILDGTGAELWSDAKRSSFFGGRERVDREADTRVLDLSGDGRLAVRFRAVDEEWYVLPTSAQVPEAPPPCLE